MNTLEVPEEMIGTLLENANWAPSHKQTEPWRFMVIGGNDRVFFADKIDSALEELSQNGIFVNHQKAAKLKENLVRVPVTIAVIMQRDLAERIPEWEETAAVAMAVQNMWLTATELGLAGFWSTPEFTPLLGPILGLNESQRSLGFFHVGFPALDFPSPGRGPWEEKIMDLQQQ